LFSGMSRIVAEDSAGASVKLRAVESSAAWLAWSFFWHAANPSTAILAKMAKRFMESSL
jgi:hypothetical protein